MENKPRKPWLSGLLTFPSIGLGHFYAGAARRGIILFIIGQIFWVITFSSFRLYTPIGPIMGISFYLCFFLFCIVDAIKRGKIAKNSFAIKKYNQWYYYLLYWLVAAFLIQPTVGLIVRANIVQAYTIPSGAMEDTLLVGDFIFADRAYRDPKQGDVIVFKYPRDPHTDFIKRCIATEGQTVEIVDKKVYINSELIPMPEYAKTTRPWIYPRDYTGSQVFESGLGSLDNMGPFTVPDNMIFVMGDNRDNSSDSRTWGFVPHGYIKGKALLIYWSWDKLKKRPRLNRIGDIIH